MSYVAGLSFVCLMFLFTSQFGKARGHIQTYNSSSETSHYRCQGYSVCHITKKPKSCLDVYNEDCRNPSGEYVLYQGNQALRVYCSFEKDLRGGVSYGYTFISRSFSGPYLNILPLYTTSKFAKLRILDIQTSTQRDVSVENISKYSYHDLKFAFNGDSRYQRPIKKNYNLHPYLFLGFLDTSIARNRNLQGYRAAGTDFTFTNCDSNPNSYIAFFFDPHFGTMGYTHEIGSHFMQRWISLSNIIMYPKQMNEHFYMDWEMHMGGCGGFQTSKTINKKAALGMPFGGYHADGCNVGWDLANGECYFFSRFAVNFFTAQNFCKLYGGKLAEIDEYNEFAALRSISRRKGNEKYWIGLTDVFVEGVWLRPSTQEVQGFYQWESGEPNNLGGNENCVEVYPNTLLWNDLPCDRNRKFICEKE